uniref:Uncharacterized protein n=1 Tax=Photinus pyralis TaxID=7054 RepID=A0A1Y1MVU3_PHOPY
MAGHPHPVVVVGRIVSVAAAVAVLAVEISASNRVECKETPADLVGAAAVGMEVMDTTIQVVIMEATEVIMAETTATRMPATIGGETNLKKKNQFPITFILLAQHILLHIGHVKRYFTIRAV